MPLRRELPPVHKFGSVTLPAGFLHECKSSVAAELLSFKQYPVSGVTAAPADRLSGTASLRLVFRQKYSLGEHIGRLSLLAERDC